MNLIPSTKIPLLGIILVSLVLSGCTDRFTPPRDESLLLKTESEIRMLYGEPSEHWEGHFGQPSENFLKRYDGEIKTLRFDRVGYELYNSLEKRKDDWIVITNVTVEEGTIID